MFSSKVAFYFLAGGSILHLFYQETTIFYVGQVIKGLLFLIDIVCSMFEVFRGGWVVLDVFVWQCGYGQLHQGFFNKFSKKVFSKHS